MTVGAAVVGLGIGEAHARAYTELEGSRLVVVHDLDPERTAEVATLLRCRGATSFEDVLADPEVELVSIASFDNAHFEQALGALAAGKHVFVEKPLCRTISELDALERAWRVSGLQLGSNLVLRAAPLYRWLREAVAAGELGELYAFDGDYLYGRLHKITDGWRRDIEDYSVMLGGGIHLVDLMLWLTSERPVSVFAGGNGISTTGTAFRYADFVSAHFGFQSGLVGRITANFGCMQPHRHVVRVFGTRATVLVDDAGARVYRSRDPDRPPERLDLPALPAGKASLIPEFLQRVRGGGRRAETLHEFDVIRACVAADEALGRGESVDIDAA